VILRLWAGMALVALQTGWAGAHPVDLVAQTAYLTLTPGEVQLRLEITPGIDVVALLLGQLDANSDANIVEAEVRDFAALVLVDCALLVDCVAAKWTITLATVSPYDLLATGYGNLSLRASAPRTDATGDHLLIYNNRYLPSFSQATANVFLAAGFQVTGQVRSDDGSLLIVAYTLSGS
jgi:hypothetical protein